MRPPAFWNDAGALQGRLLAPAAWLYTRIARPRQGGARRAPVPVVCIGNAVLGGAGKTPVALAVAERLAAAGHRPHFLSRGYGGQQRGPVRVDPAAHGAGDVGDEPLLLARVAPAWVARNRPAGALAAADAGASIVVMDD
ncbi:MAG: tetraacyldisaccharide 4'-kinase, partial [Alphaproteobacteria bacterium]|nr:tetraacyldisaccharide 4'-kinase [Alphaproteobacteria bacterium]